MTARDDVTEPPSSPSTSPLQASLRERLHETIPGPPHAYRTLVLQELVRRGVLAP